MTAPAHDTEISVVALYRFARIGAPGDLRRKLGALCCELGLRGTLLVAREGVNGTVAGTPEATRRLVAWLESEADLAGMEVKFSTASAMPFHRMKVRLKKEIVTMGVDDLDPARSVGTYVKPRDWNALISDPGTVVVDTRNAYEVALGTFAGAVDPGTSSFGEFPAWVDRNRNLLQGRKVAMFCTGGIRCEKATSYLRAIGIDEVFHLKGGILKYLEEMPEEGSLWRGECFVFDERVSVGHGLREGEATLCRACRRPLTARDRASPFYVEGVSCASCHEERTDDDRARYAERQRQVQLAAERGSAPHIGR